MRASKFLLNLAPALLLISCQTVYLPNSRNVPMLSKAGEVQGSLSFLSGYNLQTAVALTDHFAVMGNGSYASSREVWTDIRSKYTLGELGVGYFKNDGKIYFDLFGGYGAGKTSSSDSSLYFYRKNVSSNHHLSSVNYRKYFIQGGFGLRRKYFEGALALRFSLIDITNGTRLGSAVDVNQSPVMFLEPAAVIRFPLKNFVLSAQVGFSEAINSYDLRYEYVPITISTGIGLRLGYKNDQ